jgi:hypothetical protein
MEGTESVLGHYPKCPHCKSEIGFNITPCPHTTGLGGLVELISCKSCETLINAVYPPNSVHED